MKKFLTLCALFGISSLLSESCHAQEQVPLSKEQQNDVGDLVRKIKAQLPIGWTVEYPVESRSYGEGFSPKQKTKAKSEEPIPLFDRIKVKRPGILAMSRLVVANGYGNDPTPLYEEFELGFKIEPFLTTAEYNKIVANNDNIQKQLNEMSRVLKGMKVNHKFDYYMPKTAEEKEKVNAYNDLKRQLVSPPKFYFGKISLNYDNWGWNFEEFKYDRVKDKIVRRECALVTQKIDSLLTQYSGEKFKFDEEAFTEVNE